MGERPRGRTISVTYSCRNGVHTFLSDEVRGLWAANPDLEIAYRAVGMQLGILLAPRGAEPVAVEPVATLDQFKRWLAATGRSAEPEITNAAISEWATKRMTRATT